MRRQHWPWTTEDGQAKQRAAKLKPCPFCGSPAQLGGRKTVSVECIKCTAVTLQTLSDPESAIRDWNRRRS